MALLLVLAIRLVFWLVHTGHQPVSAPLLNGVFMEVCLLANGHVVVSYNKHRLTIDDDAVFRWAVLSYKHLMARNSALSLRQFAKLISSTYAMDKRLSEVLRVIDKASVSMIVTCKFSFQVNGQSVVDHRVLELEQFTDLKSELIKVSGHESVEVLASEIIACPFVKGSMSYKADVQVVNAN
jgi:hypothetical protein